MILILECGSTKSDWSVISKEGVENRFSGDGINPSTIEYNLLREHIKDGVASIEKPEDIKKIYHYGAGVSGKEQEEILSEIYTHYFPHSAIEVNNDVVAAVRSTLGNKEGIVCILGTGSNSCYFDGQCIAANYNGLGHMIGDEGSGVDLGTRIIKLFYSESLPPHIKKELEPELGNRSAFVKKLYNHPKPNRYLATFAKFAGTFKDEMVVREEIRDAFQHLIRNYLSKYPKVQELPINFVGSISIHFKEILEEVLSEKGLTMGTIVLKPIHQLEIFHTKDL
ncbi:BadF/BadG/BcrA/BcrD ATPase family protein [Membranihabitans maritimus]|uniref:BadF/BadG/BcrA/BcrD ATPase family protein n=1 Tax=Membranihabitans maritimus TaxID=2904244 RepID=UPI001F354980|nr:BadF/BadG/BcrA/BcrD ATPase family protein [Membranihabitans maritimus]